MLTKSLPPKLQILALEELNEIASKTPNNLSQLKEWIKTQQVNARIDDLWLLNFLRGCKFDLEKTKAKLICYSNLRQTLPEFYTNRDPLLPEIQEILKLGIILPLISEDFTAILVQWKAVNPAKISFLNIMKVGLMFFDVFLYEYNTCIVTGQHVIDNFGDFSLGYVTQITPTLLKKMVVDLQTAYPLRLKGFYCINTPILVKLLFTFAKAFLSNKLQQRIHHYGNNEFDRIKKFIPINIIPKDYGGEGSEINKLISEWKQKIESYRDWFLEDVQLYSNKRK